MNLPPRIQNVVPVTMDGDIQLNLIVVVYEVPANSISFRLRKGLRAGIDVAAGIRAGATSIPLVTKVPVGVSSNARTALVEPSCFAPKSILELSTLQCKELRVLPPNNTRTEDRENS